VTHADHQLALRKGTDSDNAGVYLATDLAATLDILDEAIRPPRWAPSPRP
jgi:hypothetical protein